ncbi:MAG: AMP-binding protein [Duganella sp.]
MADLVEHLAAALAARPAGALVGWRAGAPVDNAAFLARAGAWYALLNAQAGRNFALYLDDSIEFGAALLGAWHAGKTIWLGADTLDATCAELQAVVDGFLGEYPAALAPLSPALSDAGMVPTSALDAAAPALVVFTSGSTGAPQAIPKKLSQIASEVAMLEVLFGAAAGAAPGVAVWATVSHQHIYGLLFKVLWPLTAGRPLHAKSLGFHEELAVALAAGPCVLVASPAHLKRLPEHLDWRGAAQMLRAVFSSGGPLAPQTALATGALLGKVPLEVYGSSETGGVAWRQRAHAADDAWQAFPTVAWRLGEEGTLEVRSPHLADDEWLALADRAVASDDQGQRFVLQGRSDRIVKIEEKRISLTAVEAALLTTGLVTEARVIVCEPVAGEQQRQRLAAFAVLTAEGQALLASKGRAALNQHLRAALALTVEAVALPRRWRYLDRMPVNAQGKTTQAALLTLLAEAPPHLPHLPRMRELETELAAPLQRVLLELTAPANLLYFDGHFDAAPILPGVVQLEWALHYGRQYFSLPPRFAGVNVLKFQQVLQPEQPVQLELVHDHATGNLNFRYVSPAGQHASGRIVLKREGADV